jgi:hypothetical protein
VKGTSSEDERDRHIPFARYYARHNVFSALRKNRYDIRNYPPMSMHKVIRFGNSSGIILPKSCLQRLAVHTGDLLALTEAPGGYRLTRYDPIVDIQLIHAADIERRRRAVLRALKD